VIKNYGASCTWVTGVAVDIAGAVLMIKAVSQAPTQTSCVAQVSIVQPVSGCGLAVLAFSHFDLHEVMHGLDCWVLQWQLQELLLWEQRQRVKRMGIFQ